MPVTGQGILPYVEEMDQLMAKRYRLSEPQCPHHLWGGDSVLQLRVAFPILSSTDGFNKYGLMHRAFVVFMWGSPGSGGLTSPPDGLVF